MKDDFDDELNDLNTPSDDESDLEYNDLKKNDSDTSKNDKNKLEHFNPKSYSWFLMRIAILKYSLHCLASFLSILGIEHNGNLSIHFNITKNKLGNFSKKK